MVNVKHPVLFVLHESFQVDMECPLYARKSCLGLLPAKSRLATVLAISRRNRGVLLINPSLLCFYLSAALLYRMVIMGLVISDWFLVEKNFGDDIAFGNLTTMLPRHYTTQGSPVWDPQR